MAWASFSIFLLRQDAVCSPYNDQMFLFQRYRHRIRPDSRTSSYATPGRADDEVEVNEEYEYEAIEDVGDEAAGTDY